MQQLSVSQFQGDVARVMTSVMVNHDIFRVRQMPETDIVMLRADEWEQLQETLYVLQNQSLMKQIAESLKSNVSGRGYKPTTKELHEIISV